MRMIRFRYRVHCLGCGNREDALKQLKVCACCKVATYCGPKCQRQDWESHRLVCTYLSSFKSQ
ncbi:putative protein MSS51-like protein [Diplonema papillatum]|nr:putative protein MSS51-like protein [Diplonema papillatum]